LGLPRFHLPADDLGRSLVDLGRSALDHLKARRVRPGDLISLFDGSGGEALGRVVEVDRTGARVEITERLEPTPAPFPKTTLALGVCRWERLRLAVEKATELGAFAVQPVLVERSRPAAKGLAEKLRRTVIESLKQCGRSVGPEVREPLRLDGVLAASAGQDLCLLLDRDGGRFPEPGETAPENILILAGPEGGLSRSERQAAGESGFVPIALSRAVLRVETAVLAGLVLVREHWGRPSNGRPGRG
jgi:16S rRNA (uracil1498-N3)-methyltransferase